MDEIVARLADLEADVCVVPVSPATSPAEMLSEVRGAKDALVLVVFDPALADLERAMMLAAVEPLAIALAPATRLAALDVAPTADVESIAAAARFLVAATGTTGQVLRIER